MDHPIDHARLCAAAAQPVCGAELAAADFSFPLAGVDLLLVDRQAVRAAAARRASAEGFAAHPLSAHRWPGQHERTDTATSAALDADSDAGIQPGLLPRARREF